MPILLLIRHATNDFVKTGRLPGQTPNIHLNEEGRKQAEALGELLKKRPLDAVYSSQLERAIETAWRLAAQHGLAIHIRKSLADIDNGDFTGKVVKELGESKETKELWKVVVETPSQAKFPNGEAMADMQQRVVDALERIIAAHGDVDIPEELKEQKGASDAEPATPQAGSEQKAKDSSQTQTPNANADTTEQQKPEKRPQIVAVVAHADVIKAALAHYLDMPFDSFQKLGVSPASVSTVMIGADEKTGKRHVMVMSVNQMAS